jgi:hypothetical protein
VAAGGLLGAGCAPWGTGFLPSFGDLRNYELLVEASFTPEQAIQILTPNGARILGGEARIGSIAAGKAADLVVRGNPAATPAQVYEVTLEFRDGIGYDSAALRAGLADRRLESMRGCTPLPNDRLNSPHVIPSDRRCTGRGFKGSAE